MKQKNEPLDQKKVLLVVAILTFSLTGCSLIQGIFQYESENTPGYQLEELPKDQFPKDHNRSITKGEIAKLAKLDEDKLQELEKLEAYSPFPGTIKSVIVVLPTYVPPDFQISNIEIGSGWLFYEILYTNHKNNSCFKIYAYSQGGGAAAQFTTTNVISSEIGSIIIGYTEFDKSSNTPKIFSEFILEEYSKDNSANPSYVGIYDLESPSRPSYGDANYCNPISFQEFAKIIESLRFLNANDLKRNLIFENNVESMSLSH